MTSATGLGGKTMGKPWVFNREMLGKVQTKSGLNEIELKWYTWRIVPGIGERIASSAAKRCPSASRAPCLPVRWRIAKLGGGPGPLTQLGRLFNRQFLLASLAVDEPHANVVLLKKFWALPVLF